MKWHMMKFEDTQEKDLSEISSTWYDISERVKNGDHHVVRILRVLSIPFLG